MAIFKKLLGGFTVTGASVLAWIGYDIQRYRVYQDQSFGDAAKHYVSVRSLAVLGSVMRKRLEEATKDVERVQEQFLLDQIKDNLNTEYIRDMQLGEVKSVKDFISKHRLTYPHDYTRYVGRMMSGEERILTAEEPVVFAVTSGTSGTSNVVPMVSKQTKLFFLEGISVLYNCMTKAFPETKFLNKDLKIFYTPFWRYSVKGIPIGPNSASPQRSKDLLHIYTTPPAAYEVTTEPEALYIYLLFALMDPHVGMIEANFSSIIYNALNTLQTNLPQLTADIEAGRVSPGLKIDSEVRKRLDSLMKPDPQRATDIRAAARDGGEGLAKRIWPDLHVILGVDTGTFEIYGDKLRNGFAKGVPLYSPIYAASEGLLGINIWPTQLPSRYLLHPRTQFFEFIRESEMDADEPKTLLLHQVKEGEKYEVVITNPSCLYRYRFGDVVKVVVHYNQCPVVEFKYRKGQFLNVRGEKTSEDFFYKVLKDNIRKIYEEKVNLVDYCCAESVMLEGLKHPKSLKSTRPCYHVFLEAEPIADGKNVPKMSGKQNKMLDDALMEQSYVYSSFRRKGSIDPVQIHMVKPGSFNELRALMVTQASATSNQYKVPRVLRKQKAVEFMIGQIVS